MAERQLPENRVIDGLTYFRRDLEEYPLGIGDITSCFVCGEPVTYWGSVGVAFRSANDLATHAEGYRSWVTTVAVECEHCNLLDLRRKEGRCGWVEGWKRYYYYGFDRSRLEHRVLQEAYRILASNEERTVRPTDEAVQDPTAWMVYADWLDEHDLPLNAEAVRKKYGRLAGTAV